MTALLTTVLGLGAADLAKKLNPLGEPHGFAWLTTATVETPISEADVVETLQATEEYVLSRIPERYRQLARRVDGEVVCNSATALQTAFQCGLWPVVTGTLKVYANYSGVWTNRDPFDEVTQMGYTVALTTSTGAFTITPGVPQGSRVVAEYEHTAMTGCRLLKGMVLNMAAAEWGRRLPMMADKFEVYRDWETQSYSDLKRMNEKGDGRLGIDLLDQLDLVNETRANRQVAETFDPGGGML